MATRSAYDKCVEWIARFDHPDVTSIPETQKQMTVQMVSDVFVKHPMDVAAAVVRWRTT